MANLCRHNQNITKHLKKALQIDYEKLSQALQAKDIIPALFSSKVLDQRQKQHVDKKLQIEGAIAQAECLLSYILEKEEGKLHQFVNILNEKQPYCFQLLHSTLKKIENGEIQILNLQAVKEHLIHVYEQKRWCSLKPIPGENFCITVADDKLFMTPVFTAQVFDNETRESQQYNRFFGQNKENYRMLQCKTVCDIFNALHGKCGNDDASLPKVQQNLIVCTGIAGVGKTTVVRKMVCDWSRMKLDRLKKYELMFLIPLRDVNNNAHIIDILDDLNLLPKGENENLREYLTEPHNAAKVAFIIDGADEGEITKDSDIHGLISGNLYPGCTVLVTARPESENLEIITQLPQVKVMLHGTDDDSVDRFISETIKEASSKEMKAFKQKCRDQLSDFTLLHVPLFLTLICCVFNDNIANNMSVQDFPIPETVTDLFHAFILVLIRRWMKRCGHNAEDIHFINSPIDDDSNIPEDMKRCVYFIGRMCYYGVIRKCYEFNEQDAKRFKVSEKEIKDSGIFCVARNEEHTTFFTKHKLIQEYLAGIYLAYENDDGCSTPTFISSFSDAANLDLSLLQIAHKSNLVETVKYACGTSCSFCKLIFSVKSKSFCLARSSATNCINLYYEASLIFEAKQKDVILPLFRETLSACSRFSENEKEQFSVMKLGDSNYYRKCLTELVGHLSKVEALDLLKKCYSLELCDYENGMFSITTSHEQSSQVTRNEVLPSFTNDSLRLCLDQFQGDLLSKFVCVGVSSVLVRNEDAGFIDLEKLCQIFPGLKMVDIASRPFISHDTVSTSSTTNGSVLERVTLCSAGSDVLLTEHQIHWLSEQGQMKELFLRRIDILSWLSNLKLKPKWYELSRLSIYLQKILNQAEIESLCSLLSTCRFKLHRLSLVFDVHKDVNLAPLVSAIQGMEQLNRLFVSIRPSGITKQLLMDCIPSMSNLKHISVHTSCIGNTVEDIVTAICQNSTLQDLRIWDWGADWKGTGYVFPIDSVNKLAEKNIRVITLKPWDMESLDSLIDLLNSL